jgi:hypothetical protein
LLPVALNRIKRQESRDTALFALVRNIFFMPAARVSDIPLRLDWLLNA